MKVTEKVESKSLRTFGLIWCAIFTFISVHPLSKGGDIRLWSAYVAISFLAVSLLDPRLFERTGIYKNWIKFGEFIGKINSKIIIFILFFLIVTPIGILVRIVFNKDLLKKKLDKSQSTYFEDRDKCFSKMENQF